MVEIEVEIFQNINIKYLIIFSSQEEGEEAGGREEGGLQAADSKAKTCHLVINQSGASIESADPVLVSDWSSPSSSIPTHHHQLPPSLSLDKKLPSDQMIKRPNER